MALEMDVVKEDGTVGTYLRLIYIRFPEFRRDTQFVRRGQLTFNVYRDQAAAKEEGRQPFKQLFIEVDADFYAGIPDIFSMSFNQIAQEVYKRKDSIPGLDGALDIM